MFSKFKICGFVRKKENIEDTKDTTILSIWDPDRVTEYGH